MLDPSTPPDVVVTETPPPRITDPTLGVALGPRSAGAPAIPADPAHPLVTIGDSLTHGLTSGAVFRTSLSWPAQVAAVLGIERFAVPSYGGPLDGLPLNIESLVRRLETKFGDDVNVLERVRMPLVLHRILDANEDYWERGDGSDAPATEVRYENVGIYGWDLRDALSYTAARAAARVSAGRDDDLFGVKPARDNDIAALSVLAPFGVDATQVDAVRRHGDDGGIGTLIVALGANNALDAVVSKRVVWSAAGFDDIDENSPYNVWRPTHFAQEYAALVSELRTIRAQRVVLSTVPHVTIAPLARGVNPDDPGEKWRAGSRYFPYYTDPWIDDDDFRPSRHRHLTHQQARAIDSAIDQYNATIADAVAAARRDGRDWFVLDLCGLLDSVAYRRYEADPQAARVHDWVPYELPPPIADLDTRFFRSSPDGRRQGGLFGLDGIHPTTSGYGIIAQEALDVLAVAGIPSTAVDFAAVLEADTLNSDPPALFDEVFELIAPFATRWVTRR
jgi:lysophospholipase L1-like esterase